MVVFEDGVSKRSEYRRFSIRGADGLGAIDDTSAVYETLMRRFRHGNIAGDSGESIESEKKAASAAEANANASTSVSASVSTSEGIVQQNTDLHHFAYKPNLIVVDGGKPQVEAAARALADSHITDVALCGLAKKLEEVWLPGEDYPLILKRQSEGMYLLQRVRDESHRFAITYHRKKRRKGEISSVLDSIAGIGPAYGKRLLRHFGSVKKLRAASKEEIEEVKGIGAVKAETIFTALHAEESAKDASVNSATVNDASATAAQSSQRG
jgi:excinuclease ABC subunit C